MRLPLLSLLLSCAPLLAPVARSAETASGPDLARAKAILEKWETTAPKAAERKLHIVYWTPADTGPAPAFRERLSRLMLYTRDFYAKQIAAYGLGGRTIRLQLEPDGLLCLPVVRGSKPFDAYGDKSGAEIRKDCADALKARGVDVDNETLVIFCNLARWDAAKRTLRQSSPYCGIGTHRSGTCWQVDSPLLDPALLGVKDAMLTDRQYGHISVGRYNSIFVGGVVHELGHSFGLPHCCESVEERAARGHALMGDGNRTMGEELRGEGRGTFLTAGHALKLAAHPMFSGSVKDMAAPAEVRWDSVALRSAPGGAHLEGRVSANLPVLAVLVYADPEGGDNYDASIAATVPDEQGRFAVDSLLNRMARAGRGEIRLIAVCANGAATGYAGSESTLAFPYRKNTDGSADVSSANAVLALESALAARKDGKLAEADAAKQPPVVREILARLDQPDSAAGKPLATTFAGERAALSDLAPESVKVGYGKVHFDRDMDGAPLSAAREPRAHGILAHAYSVLTYRLDGRWKRLKGEAGQNATGHGKVVLTVLGDGRELWKSGVTEAGAPKPFAVDVSGVTTLELRAAGVDGDIGGAHAAWFEPTLER